MTRNVAILCEDQIQRIKAFLRVVDAIKKKRLLENGLFPSGLRIEANAETGVWAEKLEQPDEELLVSALVEIRKLILDREPAHIFGLHNMLYPKLEDEELKSQLGELNNNYRRLLNKGLNEFSVGVNIGQEDADVEKKSPLDALKIWLNGIYFHNDRELQEELESKLREIKTYLRFQFLIGMRILIMFSFSYEAFIRTHFGDQL